MDTFNTLIANVTKASNDVTEARELLEDALRAEKQAKEILAAEQAKVKEEIIQKAAFCNLDISFGSDKAANDEKMERRSRSAQFGFIGELKVGEAKYLSEKSPGLASRASSAVYSFKKKNPGAKVTVKTTESGLVRVKREA